VDAVDATDTVLGAVPRGDVLRTGINFRVVHVLLFNHAGQLLLQRIAPGLRHEGAWGSSAAGFVLSQESYAAAAARKLTEELNVVAELAAIGKISMLDGASIKFIGVYAAAHDGPFMPDPGSASEIEFLSPQSIADHRKARSRAFTPTFLTVLDYYQNQTAHP
jgi:isopentenyldiphosphate isomerase